MSTRHCRAAAATLRLLRTSIKETKARYLWSPAVPARECVMQSVTEMLGLKYLQECWMHQAGTSPVMQCAGQGRLLWGLRQS